MSRNKVKWILLIIIIAVSNYVNSIYYAISCQPDYPIFYNFKNINCSIKNEKLNKYLGYQNLKFDQYDSATIFLNEVVIKKSRLSFSCFFNLQSDSSTIRQIVLKGIYIDDNLYRMNKDLGVIETFYIKNQFSKLLSEEIGFDFEVHRFL